MTRWMALLLACLALGLVVAGCGGDDDDDGGGGGAAETTEQPADEGGGDDTGGGGGDDTGGGGGGGDDTGGGGGGGTEVSEEGIAFVPGDGSLAVGNTVTWTNNDDVPHDVTADTFSSGEPGGMQPGDVFEHTFEEAGNFDYVCTLHPGMEGTVTVE
jgi:plastocyanin